MFEKIKRVLFNEKTPLNNKEKEFFKKTHNYLIKNCHFVYSLDYIPRLIRRLGKLKEMNISVIKGKLNIKTENKKYSLPYVINRYKGNIIDMNLFVVKNQTKLKRKYIRANLDKDSLSIPNYIIGDIPNNISYIAEEFISFKDGNYQTSLLYDDYNEIDDLILAMYNNSKLQMVLKDIKNIPYPLENSTSDLRYVSGFKI